MALSDDEQLISDYLQWRSVKEVTIPDYTPQAFMRERVMEMAVDRIEEALEYINTSAPRGSSGNLAPSMQRLKEILEGSDGNEEQTDKNREVAGQESSSQDDGLSVTAGP